METTFQICKQHQGRKNFLKGQWSELAKIYAYNNFSVNFHLYLKNYLSTYRNKVFLIPMNLFTNMFQSHLKDCPQTPDEFSEYKLEFLHFHEPSYKELGDVFFTKDEDKNDPDSFNNLPDFTDQDNQDMFELEVQIKLRKYTSFENGFMENHRKILINSLQQFLQKNSKIQGSLQINSFSIDIHSDIKSVLFDENLFTGQQIAENKQRFRKKVDEFKILKQMFENLYQLQKNISKDAILLGLWIMKHTDHIVQGILHENSFCINEVLTLKSQLLNYLAQNPHINCLKETIASQSEATQEFNLMIESWLYTLLIAKLGYFENDSFNEELSLEEHLSALLRKQKRQHSVFEGSDSEDEEIMSLELLSKKRKI